MTFYVSSRMGEALCSAQVMEHLQISEKYFQSLTSVFPICDKFRQF